MDDMSRWAILKTVWSDSRQRSAQLLIFALLLSVSGSVARAQQEFRLYKPYDRYRYMPRVPSSDERPEPLPDVPTEVTGDPKVLVEELKGLVFVDSPDKVVKEERLETTGIQVRSDGGLQLLQTPAFHYLASGYLGGPVSLRRLNELVREVIVFYRQNDMPVVDVSVPQQNITSGVAQIVVTEARVGEVRVEGAHYFDPCVLEQQPFISPGCPIYESVLMEDLRWLIRNPFRRVELKLTPGQARGLTDVVFQVEDRLPWRVYMGYEDTGTRPLGLDRTFYGFNWNNAFDRDDQLGYQYTASSDFTSLTAHSAFYSHALLNRDIVTVYGSYADFGSFIPGFGQSSGEAWQVLTRWYRELCRSDCVEHGITAGFDLKHTTSGLEFGTLPVSNTPVGVAQFMVGYQRKTTDALGTRFFTLDGVNGASKSQRLGG